VASDASGQAALARALLLALGASAGRLRVLPDSGSLGLRRPSGALPWLVQVLPLRPGRTGAFSAWRGAVMLVTNPAARSTPSVGMLQRLLGLTPAEAGLAAGLVAGRTLAAQAAQRGVSIETLRTHLVGIRRKTGCRRQSELTALLARLS
jgi:DNA-binding CsgD family transcriptional regulator